MMRADFSAIRNPSATTSSLKRHAPCSADPVQNYTITTCPRLRPNGQNAHRLCSLHRHTWPTYIYAFYSISTPVSLRIPNEASLAMTSTVLSHQTSLAMTSTVLSGARASTESLSAMPVGNVCPLTMSVSFWPSKS